MSKPAQSLFIFGLYLFGLSLALLVYPNFLLRLFGVPQTNEVWIRVVGMLLLFLSCYNIQAARAELRDFMRWSVYARGAVIFFFTTFVVLKLAPAKLILFGAVDLAAAIWTALALNATKASKENDARVGFAGFNQQSGAN